MYIVIAGAGMVGSRLAERLAHANHDVVVVDLDKTTCERIYSRLGVMVINGNATSIEILEEAGLRKADIVVGVMRYDADNLAFTVLARHFEVPRIIVRMRDSRYQNSFQMAGAHRILNIVDLYLEQLVLEIEQPNVHPLLTLGGGKASIIEVRIPDNSPVDNVNIAELTNRVEFPKECVIAGIYRDQEGKFIIPGGNQPIKSGDRVFLAATTTVLRTALTAFGLTRKDLSALRRQLKEKK